jgi:hypothetical protein
MIVHEKNPVLMPCPGHQKYILQELWPFEIRGQHFRAVPGFEYDGASIPRGAWYSTYSPFHPIVMRAALEHDYLCAYKPKGISSKHAAVHFRDALTKATPIKKALMYMAVLWFGPQWDA